MNDKTETFMAVLLVLGLLIFAMIQVKNQNVINAPRGGYYGTDHSDMYMP